MMSDLKQQLRRFARAHDLEDFYVLRLYILENLLIRLTKVYPEFQNIIVRGSLITRQWGYPKHFRTVEDLDFMVDEPFKEAKGKLIVDKMLRLNLNDGLCFNQGYQFNRIWEETELPALRFQIPVHILGEMLEIQIDMAFNDPLIPPAVFQEYVTILDKKIQVFTILPELACAWKIHGLFEFWDKGNRWQSKTLYDIFVIMDTQSIDKNILKPAIKVAFEDRKTPFEVYQRVLDGEFGQSRGSRRGWEKWLEQNEGKIHFESFEPLLKAIRSNIDDIFIELMG